MPQYFSNTEKKKSNTVRKGETGLVDGDWVPMFCFCQQSQNHNPDIPLKVQMGAIAEKATEWTVNRKDV